MVSVDEQKLEARTAEQGTGGAEEAAPFRVARQVAEVAEGDERVAALLDGALDQAAQVASVAVQVTEDEQPAHSSRAYVPGHLRDPRRCEPRSQAEPREVEDRSRAVSRFEGFVSDEEDEHCGHHDEKGERRDDRAQSEIEQARAERELARA